MAILINIIGTGPDQYLRDRSRSRVSGRVTSTSSGQALAMLGHGRDARGTLRGGDRRPIVGATLVVALPGICPCFFDSSLQPELPINDVGKCVTTGGRAMAILAMLEHGQEKL